jgi:hypothetical protein
MTLSRNDSYGRNDIYKVSLSAPEAQLAAINQKLKEPEATVPSSEIDKELLKQNTKEDLRNETGFVNSLGNKAEPILASVTTGGKQAGPDPAEASTAASNTSTLEKTSIQPTPVHNSDEDSSLSEGQKKAWHKLLYGGLGILAVFTFFILLLLRKSRKKDNKQNL